MFVMYVGCLQRLAHGMNSFISSEMCSPSKTNVSLLYLKYRNDILKLRQVIRAWSSKSSVSQGVGDVEAEILYMRIRELRPKHVAEFGFGQGLTTMYILQALKDNEIGALHTFELSPRWDRVKMIIPGSVKWKLYPGNAMQQFSTAAVVPEYIHSDAEHSTTFAKWLVDQLAEYPSSCSVSVHDVFVSNSPYYKSVRSGRTPEGLVVIKFLHKFKELQVKNSDIEVFSVAKSRCGDFHSKVLGIRQNLGIDNNWISRKPSSLNNPSLFFNV